MKKKKIFILTTIVALILLIPKKINYKDGGSVGYKSALYEVTNYSSLSGEHGIEIKILGIKVFRNVRSSGGFIPIDDFETDESGEM